MSEQVLNILKLTLLGLIYLFFGRVLWAVWSEVRAPRTPPMARTGGPVGQPPAVQQPVPSPGPYASTAAQPRPAQPDAPPAPAPPRSKQTRKPPKGRGGRAARLVILEPKHRRGVAIGALAGCFSVLVHSIFDFVLHTPAISLMFILLMALIVVCRETYPDDFELPDWQKRRYTKPPDPIPISSAMQKPAR